MLAGEDMSAQVISRMAESLEAECDMPLGMVVGGGASARRYIDVARELGLDEAGLDHLGIQLTRANAWLLVSAFGERAFPRPAEDFEEAALALRSYDRVCMGGTHPGHTTDAVAAMLAERVKADRLVIVTNVDGVFTADPRQDPGAELLERLTPAELTAIVGSRRQAGSSGVVDPLAAQMLQRSQFSAAVVNGDDPANVAAAINGQAFKGSSIEPEDTT